MDWFEEWFPINIVSTLEKMSLNVEKSSFFCLNGVVTFEFIVVLVITRNVLDVTLPGTELLQVKVNDIPDGLKTFSFSFLKNMSVIMRNSVDIHHNRWYYIALSLSDKVEVVEAKPRTCRREINISNLPSDVSLIILRRPLLFLSQFDEIVVVTYNGLTIILKKNDFLSKSFK